MSERALRIEMDRLRAALKEADIKIAGLYTTIEETQRARVEAERERDELRVWLPELTDAVKVTRESFKSQALLLKAETMLRENAEAQLTRVREALERLQAEAEMVAKMQGRGWFEAMHALIWAKGHVEAALAEPAADAPEATPDPHGGTTP
jgi:septation ring formation regulator EzrA